MTLRTVLLVALLAAPANAQPVGPKGNLPLAPDEVVRRLRDEPFQIVEHKDAGGGVMGAQHWRLLYADGQALDAKWKTAPSSGDGWNNSPRLETAAYAVQQLFLDPADQVVPPSVIRCVPLATFRSVADDAHATFPESTCVYGSLSAWLSNVREPEHALDTKRFSRDPRYAYHFANLNLFAYLVEHRDARANNFLMSTDPDNPQVFSIDNGISFGAIVFNWFMGHLDKLRVAGLPRISVERLRRVTQADLDHLGVLGQLRRDAAGVLKSEPSTANLDPILGTRFAGPVVQFGLTKDEIDALAQRRQHLLELVDSREIELF